MQKYQNNAQDDFGNALVGASVTVRLYPSNVLATLYSDNGVTPLPNPTTTDTNGLFAFYAANGNYSLTITKPNITPQTFTNIQLFDPADSVKFGTVNITGTTNSTSPTTGALVVAGGVGIGGDIYCGGSYHGAAFVTSGTINSTPIGATTPSTGAFTTLTTSGAYTPNASAGIVGTTVVGNANAGSVGEYLTATPGSPVALSSGPITNVITLSLSAGDWLVGGFGYATAGTATITLFSTALSLTSATFGTLPSRTGSAGATADLSATTQTIRINVAAPTTVYLVIGVTYTGTGVTGTGTIWARRVR